MGVLDIGKELGGRIGVEWVVRELEDIVGRTFGVVGYRGYGKGILFEVG